MTDKMLEEKLAAAVEHSTPDLLDQILLACDAPKGEPLMKNERPAPKKKKSRRPLMIAAALALAACGALAAWQMNRTAIPVGRVALDVNPSVEFSVDEDDNLVDVEARNADAARLLEGLDLDDMPMEQAVDALVEALDAGGYLSETGGAVLISVDADDAHAEPLRQKIAKQVHSSMEARSLHGDVLSQSVDASDELERRAEEWDTSFGRAAYYTKAAACANLDPAQLSGLSVQQVEYLLETRGLSIQQAGVETEIDDDVTSADLVGKTLISADSALEQGLQRAGITAAEAIRPEVELDVEHGRLVYDVEFTTGGTEHEVTLDAETGELLHHDTDTEEPENDPDDDDDDDDDNDFDDDDDDD